MKSNPRILTEAQKLISRRGNRAINPLRVAAAVKENEVVIVDGITFQAILNAATAVVAGAYPVVLTAAASPAAGTGTLTSDNTAPADGETVTIGAKVYTFKTALTPAEGEVLINTTADAALLNLIRAINHSGTVGTDYQCAAANTRVTAATSVTSHAFVVTSKGKGTVEAATIATTETSAHLAWGAATLAGGTDASASDYTTALALAINSAPTDYVAERISANEVIVETRKDSPGGQACSETLSGSNNGFASATMYGGRVAGNTAYAQSLARRVPNAVEIALLSMSFVFPFAPVAALVMQTASDGTIKAFDGKVTTSGNRVTLTFSGSITPATNDLVNVLASE